MSRVALPASAGLALAASHARDGLAVVLAAVAFVAVLTVGLVAGRSPQRRWPRPLAAAALGGLALLPGGIAADPGPLAFVLGGMAAAGILALGAGPDRPAGRVRMGPWLAVHKVPLAVAALLLAGMLSGASLARLFGSAAIRHGEEWNGPYGVLLGALPVLAAAGIALLAVAALRPKPPEAPR